MTALAPTEVFTDRYGDRVAHWGQGPCAPGEVLDPVPSVYAARKRVEVGDWRLTPGHAEDLARRLLAAAAHARGVS